MRKSIFPLLLLSSYCLAFLSCATYRLEKSLDPESKEFLSQVRYLITKQERKIFLGRPISERKNFIEEFWKKRDPDPYTEENEFKDLYYRRIQEANNLFREGTTPGWLQDRGRIHILLGPPERRDTFPSGNTEYGVPTEIWYYGFFPIVFVDSSWSGDFKLEPLSARNISEINKAQKELRPKVTTEKVVFDFNLKIKKVKEEEVLFQIEVPYKNIWLTQEENKLQTTLELSLEICDLAGAKVWKKQKNYPISLKEENLEEMFGKSCLIEILANLKPGDYSLMAELKNRTDNSQVRKKGKFTL